MTKKQEELIELVRANTRMEILNDVLRYLIKKNILNPTMSYKEIEKIIKKRDKKKSN